MLRGKKAQLLTGASVEDVFKGSNNKARASPIKLVASSSTGPSTSTASTSTASTPPTRPPRPGKGSKVSVQRVDPLEEQKLDDKVSDFLFKFNLDNSYRDYITRNPIRTPEDLARAEKYYKKEMKDAEKERLNFQKKWDKISDIEQLNLLTKLYIAAPAGSPLKQVAYDILNDPQSTHRWGPLINEYSKNRSVVTLTDRQSHILDIVQFLLDKDGYIHYVH